MSAPSTECRADKNGRATSADKRDTLYAFKNTVTRGSFVFDENVAAVFDNMARRSIPGYDSIQNFTAAYCLSALTHSARLKKLCSVGGAVLDIGASLGASAAALTYAARDDRVCLSNCALHAVDYSAAMVKRMRNNLSPLRVHWKSIVCAQVDIADAHRRGRVLRNVSRGNLRAVIANFVVQFIPLSARSAVLHDIWNALAPGGMLVISEKLQANDAASQRVWDTRYKNFKTMSGYSRREIAAKQKALAGVLQPMRERDFTDLLAALPNACVNRFFSWAAFFSYAVRKESR